MLQEAERTFLIFLGPKDNRGWLRFLGETLLPSEDIAVTFSGKAGLFKRLCNQNINYRGVILRWNIEQEKLLIGVVSRIKRRLPDLPIIAIVEFVRQDEINAVLRNGVTRAITEQYDKSYLQRDYRGNALLLQS